MEYYRINYDRLKKLNQINFFLIVMIIVILTSYLIFISCFIDISKSVKIYGIINDGILEIEIESELSDLVKNNNILEFNNEIMNYKIKSFNEYEIIDNKIWQSISLTIDKKVYDNEVGEVVIHYDKQKIITYILDLFK